MTQIGLNKCELDTPALLIDLDKLENNIRKMADYYRTKKSTAYLLPHQKGHRLPVVARKQIKQGAEGVSITSLGLAEYYVWCGFEDILITNEIYGQNKISRLCALAEHANITATVDNIENATQISKTALSLGTKIDIVVELYMGRRSCGVEIERAKEFVKEIAKLEGTNFKGFSWHELLPAEFEERNLATRKLLKEIQSLKDNVEDSGIEVEFLSGGSSYTWNITPEYSTPSTRIGVQAGNYVFSDLTTKGIKGLDEFDCALTVLTRCISKPKRGEVNFDFGLNSCSFESGDDYRILMSPQFKNVKGITEIRQREEMAFAQLEENADGEINPGDVLELIPAHADTTAKLHDKYYGIRNDKVEAVWPNLGRGLL